MVVAAAVPVAETEVEVEDWGGQVVVGEVLEEDRAVEILSVESVGSQVEEDHEGAREKAVAVATVPADLAKAVEAVMARVVKVVVLQVPEGSKG